MTNESFILRKTRNDIFHDTLGEEYYCLVKKLFGFLFPDNDTIKNRCYIFLTRKGFSLWHAGTLCGLSGDIIPDAKTLICDRNWKKMSYDNRQEFIRDREVFLIDDTIITGRGILSIYRQLDSSICKSRNVVCLVESNTFKLQNAFESYNKFKTVSNDEKRELNNKIMASLYRLAIPFTAESSIYKIKRIPISTIDKWKSYTKDNKKDGWHLEETELDFGLAGNVNTSFLFHAPEMEPDAENILFRGIRVCYRNLSKEEDPEQTSAEISLIPWVMFDVIDYRKTIEYLRKHINEGSLIEKIIMSGESERKRVVIHRVISYLFGSCVKKEFDKFLEDNEDDVRTERYKIGNVDLELYHFEADLLEEIHKLVDSGCNITSGQKCPYGELLMDKESHDYIAKELFGTNWEGLEIPYEPTDIKQLETIFCAHREIEVDRETGRIKHPKPRLKYPILFYTGDNLGVTALDYVRRSIASFHSAMFFIKDKEYLANALVPGEGSFLILMKNYDFIWGLHDLLFTGTYKQGIEQEFKAFWNDKRKESIEKNNNGKKQDVDYSQLSDVTKDALDIITNNSCVFWPNRETIQKLFKIKTNNRSALIDAIYELVEAFRAKSNKPQALK